MTDNLRRPGHYQLTFGQIGYTPLCAAPRLPPRTVAGFPSINTINYIGISRPGGQQAPHWLAFCKSSLIANISDALLYNKVQDNTSGMYHTTLYISNLIVTPPKE